jgi:hypothetical protein
LPPDGTSGLYWGRRLKPYPIVYPGGDPHAREADIKNLAEEGAGSKSKT